MLKDLIRVSKYLEANGLSKESSEIGYLFLKYAQTRVESPAGDTYEYKLESGQIYTRKKGADTWIKVTKPEHIKAIEEKVFGITQQPQEPEPKATEGPGKEPAKSWYESIPGYDTARKKYDEYFTGDSSASGAELAKPLPFKNTQEGNAFRVWVNDNHSEWARANKLDRSGSHNNSYMQKAWAQFGAEYENTQEKGIVEKAGDYAYQKTLTLVNRYAKDKSLPLHVRGFISFLTGRTAVWTEGDFNQTEIEAIKDLLAYRLTEEGNKAAWSQGGKGMYPGGMLAYGLYDGLANERGREDAAPVTPRQERAEIERLRNKTAGSWDDAKQYAKDKARQIYEVGKEVYEKGGAAKARLYDKSMEGQLKLFLGSVGFPKNKSRQQMLEELNSNGTTTIVINDNYDFNDNVKVGGADAFYREMQNSWSLMQKGETYTAIRKLAGWRHQTGYNGFPIRLAIEITAEDIGQDFSKTEY